METDAGEGHGRLEEVAQCGREVADVRRSLTVSPVWRAHGKTAEREGGGDGAQARGHLVVRRPAVVAPAREPVVSEHEKERVGRKVVEEEVHVAIELEQGPVDMGIGGGGGARLVGVVVNKEGVNHQNVDLRGRHELLELLLDGLGVIVIDIEGIHRGSAVGKHIAPQFSPHGISDVVNAMNDRT